MPNPAFSTSPPPSGFDNDVILITGTGFSPDPTVTFDGVPAAISGYTDTEITTVVPLGATSGDLTVTVQGLSDSEMFFVVLIDEYLSCNLQDISSILFDTQTQKVYLTTRGAGTAASDRLLEVTLQADRSRVVQERGFLEQMVGIPKGGGGYLYFSNSWRVVGNPGNVFRARDPLWTTEFFRTVGSPWAAACSLTARSSEFDITYFLDYDFANPNTGVVRKVPASPNPITDYCYAFGFNDPAGSDFDDQGYLYTSSSTVTNRGVINRYDPPPLKTRRNLIVYQPGAGNVNPKPGGLDILAQGSITDPNDDLIAVSLQAFNRVDVRVADIADTYVDTPPENRIENLNQPRAVAFAFDAYSESFLYIAEPNRIVKFKNPLMITRRLLLGGSIQTKSDPERFKLHIPSRWGGVLVVTCGTCTSLDITDSHGQPFVSGNDVGFDNQGFFSIDASGPVGSTISNTFTQTGYASKRPWNFYWWSSKNDVIDGGANGIADTEKCYPNPPSSCDDKQEVPVGQPVVVQPWNPDLDVIRSDADAVLQTSPVLDDFVVYWPNLFDEAELIFDEGGHLILATRGALKKYDDVFRVGKPLSRDWEIQQFHTLHHEDQYKGNGHCKGAAVASVLVNQPDPDPLYGPNTPTPDQLEGLWAELGHGDTHAYPSTSPWGFDSAPCVSPIPGFDSSDEFAHKLHDILERGLMDPTDRDALAANLRDDRPTSSCTVWNHAVYRFQAQLSEPAAPWLVWPDTLIATTTTIWANKDFFPTGLIYSPDCNPPCDPRIDCIPPDFGPCLAPGFSRIVSYRYQFGYRNTGFVNTDGTYLDDFQEVVSGGWWVPEAFRKIDWQDWCLAEPCPMSNQYVIKSEVKALDRAN
jgi:hypothetical protein